MLCIHTYIHIYIHTYRKEHQEWQEKDIALTKELNTAKAATEGAVRMAKERETALEDMRRQKDAAEAAGMYACVCVCVCVCCMCV